ncbi:MAG: glutamate cyclase domain-containing protein [Chloroflexota bacterium]|nr:glutamate cyclase domain-containing protein [Chloroflexota bacterium]
MNTLRSIEKIILQNDTRNIASLEKFLKPNFTNSAAKIILENQGTVFIATGFYIVYAKASETDGPPGAIALGNALKKIGYKVVYITDKWSLEILKGMTNDLIIDFPVSDHENSKVFAINLIKELKPSVSISIERASLMEDGTYRNWKSQDISEYNAKLDYIFNNTSNTIGIGDGGNEIGMGNLFTEIKNTRGLPDKPAVTKVDELIVSSCSNWGAYGLICSISEIKSINLLPSLNDAKNLIKKCVDLGAVEGLTGEKKYAVDGRDLEKDSVCLNDLHDYLKNKAIL